MLTRGRQRKAVGNVIATLIILIASVVLASAVVFFGGSMYETNAKQMSIALSNSHVWVSPTGPSIAGFVVQNTGDVPISIQKITLRGMSVPSSSWYYNNSASVATLANILTELKYDGSPTAVNIDSSPGEEQFAQATGAVTLRQGQAMFVYLQSPANMSLMDAGLDVNLTVHADRVSATDTVHVIAN